MTMLVNTRSAQTTVRWELVWNVTSYIADHSKHLCLHWKSQTFEQAWIQLTIGGHTYQVRAHLATCLPYPVLLGQHWPCLWELIGTLAEGTKHTFKTKREGLLGDSTSKEAQGREGYPTMAKDDIGPDLENIQFAIEQTCKDGFWHMY